MLIPAYNILSRFFPIFLAVLLTCQMPLKSSLPAMRGNAVSGRERTGYIRIEWPHNRTQADQNEQKNCEDSGIAHGLSFQLE